MRKYTSGTKYTKHEKPNVSKLTVYENVKHTCIKRKHQTMVTCTFTYLLTY